MVIRAENTTFKSEYSVSSDPGTEPAGTEREAPRVAPGPLEVPDTIEPGSLDELQYVLSGVAQYVGKGTERGAVTMRDTLLRSVAALYTEVNEDNLGAALASLILLADEVGIGIDAVANSKLERMVYQSVPR